MAAHLMAQYAKRVDDWLVWVEDIPPVIENQILNDVINMNVVLDQ